MMTCIKWGVKRETNTNWFRSDREADLWIQTMQAKIQGFKVFRRTKEYIAARR